MHGLGLLALLWLLGKSSASPNYGAPVVPGSTAVTSMRTGSRYTITLRFRGFGTGQPDPPPSVLVMSANIVPTPASAFRVEPTLTTVAQGLDGSWAAQVTGTYLGGDVLLENQAWQLMQLAMAQ